MNETGTTGSHSVLDRIGVPCQTPHPRQGGRGGSDEVPARELAATMQRGRPPETTLDDGLKSAVACMAIDKAMESGRVVDVNPMWKRAGIAPR